MPWTIKKGREQVVQQGSIVPRGLLYVLCPEEDLRSGSSGGSPSYPVVPVPAPLRSRAHHLSPFRPLHRVGRRSR